MTEEPMPSQMPCFRSLAFREIPKPDYADVCLATLPEGAGTDPKEWAERLFSLKSMPRWVSAAMGLRQALVPLIGVPKAPRDTFTVTDRAGEEALIFVQDKHLNFAAAVGVDPVSRLIRVTTAVELKGWRGKLYFGVVRPVHPIVVNAMLKKAIRSQPAPR
ncbi:DUF2867 domain-containing protein [Arthrobacter sp. ISL-95]|uniref:DUF2867 domain-containing protein n=1 Tax=Arthrobacter sp. ISL-95 TaxID=2819116 RepID=UPI001BE58CD7|nr:DUF2867 domain-containing protein [Arthrobacter sp. ISL-95]MBT2586575.1 DUF2867 domain-containing protein [Arthrobacter sp. ISL-95]